MARATGAATSADRLLRGDGPWTGQPGGAAAPAGDPGARSPREGELFGGLHHDALEGAALLGGEGGGGAGVEGKEMRLKEALLGGVDFVVDGAKQSSSSLLKIRWSSRLVVGIGKPATPPRALVKPPLPRACNAKAARGKMGEAGTVWRI